jgi:large subunit ribosomal protein L9
MKVIFLKDVARVAQRDTVKEVADGYAMNALIPRGLAEQATPAKLAAWEERQRISKKERAERDRHWSEALARLNGAKITVIAKANEKGHLYNHISLDLIIQAIRAETMIEVPKESITVKNAIKDLGEFPIEIRVGNKSVTITIVVKGS